jgi:hypothetical protein
MNPNMTVEHFSDQLVFTRNGTQAFMDAKFQAEDHAFIIKEARVLDASQIKKKRHDNMIEHEKNVVETKRRKDAMKKHKQAELTA